MVLGSDQHPAGVQVLDRVVRTVMAEFHLQGLCAGSQCYDLVPKADAEGRYAFLNQFLRCLDGVVTGFRVTWSIGEENPIRRQFQDICNRGLCRYNGHFAASLSQHPQDVAFDAEVEGNDMVCLGSWLLVTGPQFPTGFIPFIRLVYGHFFRQVLTGKAWAAFRQHQRTVCIITGDDGAALGAFRPQDAGELAGVYPTDGDDALFLQVVRQGFRCTEIGWHRLEVLDDEAGCLDSAITGFDVFRIDADIADMGIGQGDNLPGIAGLSQGFLIPGHGCIENDFAGGFA